MELYFGLFAIVFLLSFRILNNSNYSGTLELKRQKDIEVKYYVMIIFILLFIVESLRSKTVGEDTKVYYSWFETYSKYDLFQIKDAKSIQDVEYGYIFFNILISKISSDPRFFIAIVSFVILLLHFSFIIKETNDIVLSILIFFCLNYFFTSMVSLRQYIAMGIVFRSYSNVKKQNYIRAIIIGFVAFLFHYSSLIFLFTCLLLPFMIKSNIFRNTIFIILGILFLSMPIVVKWVAVLFPKYKYYLDMIDFSYKISNINIIKIVLDIIMIITFKHSKTKSNTMISILLGFHVVSLLYSMIIPYAFRLSYYFDYFLILALPIYVNIDIETKKFKIGVLLVFLGIFYFYYLFVNAAQIAPYKFFWE